jgi:hypothetical protein
MFAVALLCAGFANAGEVAPEYYEIDPNSVRIVPLGTVSTGELKALGLPVKPIQIPKAPGAKGGLVVVDQIVNIANKIWKIIKDNKPAVDVKTTYATAVPKGVDHWGQLNGWSRPVGTKFGFYADNRLGQRVMDVDYVVFRTYNGKYNGKGRFLTNVTALPTKTKVSWGYTLNMSVDAAKPTNVGSSENPVAGMQMTVAWTMSNPIQDHRGRSVFYMEGDGTFQRMAGPFANPDREKVSKKLGELDPSSVSFN